MQDVGTSFGTEEALLDAIRENVEGDDQTVHADNTNADEYWNKKSAAEAQDYVRDMVYGGVDGLAYVRSVAEFVSSPTISVSRPLSTCLQTSDSLL